MIDNPNNQSKRVITQRKPAYYAEGSVYEEGGELEDKFFSQYYAGDHSREEALELLAELIATGKFRSTQAQPMINTEFKIAFYNQNDDLGIILTFNFFVSNSGVINYTKSSGVFKPQNFEWTDNNRSLLGFKTLLLGLWGIYWLIFFIHAVKDLIGKIHLFITKKQFELDWFKYIEYPQLIMCLIVLLLWFDIFLGEAKDSFTLPMDEATFIKMDEMTYKMHQYA